MRRPGRQARPAADGSARVGGLAQPAWRPRRLDLLPYFFVAPICLLLLAISFYPSAGACTSATGPRTDAGALTRLAGDAIFLQGLWRTLRWDLVVVLGQLAIALPIALFLNRRFRGRGVVRAAVLIRVASSRLSTDIVVPPSRSARSA